MRGLDPRIHHLGRIFPRRWIAGSSPAMTSNDKRQAMHYTPRPRDPKAPPVRINLLSDTQSKPTASMREAMARAEVGDEQVGDDPSVNLLCERVAEPTFMRCLLRSHQRFINKYTVLHARMGHHHLMGQTTIAQQALINCYCNFPGMFLNMLALTIQSFGTRSCIHRYPETHQ